MRAPPNSIVDARMGVGATALPYNVREVARWRQSRAGDRLGAETHRACVRARKTLLP